MKTNLLLLHGALGSKQQFEAIKSLLDSSFTLHELNFEGHGGLSSAHAFSMQRFTQNVLDYLDTQKLGNIDIFGYSMGGYVALNLARNHPEKVSSIVTLGTKINWSLEAAEKEVKMLNPEKIEEKVPHFAKKLQAEHAPQDWKEVMRKTAAMMLDMGGGNRLEENDFKAIQHEVRIGIGSEDRMVTYEESERVAQLLPNGQLIKLEGFQHPIEKVDPQTLSQYIITCLGK